MTFEDLIKKAERFQSIPERNIRELVDENNDYPHLTFVVHSLSEYLDIIKVMNLACESDELLVFRGMGNSNWLPVPSLGRIESDQVDLEYHMVNEFLTLRPDEFRGLTSDFDILAKMQHYRLPTRLLDFTLNPLISLYFSCEELMHEDARILCGKTYLKSNRNKMVEAICGSYKQDFLENSRIDELLLNVNLSVFDYIRDLYLSNDDRLLFVKPRYWNQRIINQSAIFLVFPNKLFDYLGKTAFYYQRGETGKIDANEQKRIAEIMGIEKVEQIYHSRPCTSEERSVIMSMNKVVEEDTGMKIEGDFSHIMDFYVSHASVKKLFSFYDAQMRKDSLEFENKCRIFDEVLKYRFTIEDELESIDEYNMKTNFCSILIPADVKKEMLADLAIIGIDKAFVYPELEYTAKKIVQQYSKVF